MPTYEYRCAECGNRFEVFQRIDDEPLQTCEKCGGALRKVFHPAGIVFKGSGFYATDSRRAAKTSTNSESSSGDSKEKKDTSSSGEGGTSSKEQPKEKKSTEPKKAAG
jgi:putative FmdB family regulatory protein